MSDALTSRLVVDLPKETIDRLERFAAATNGTIANATSRTINAGIDAALARWPNLKTEIGE